MPDGLTRDLFDTAMKEQAASLQRHSEDQVSAIRDLGKDIRHAFDTIQVQNNGLQQATNNRPSGGESKHVMGVVLSLFGTSIVLIGSVCTVLMFSIVSSSARMDQERLDRISQGDSNEVASIARHEEAKEHGATSLASLGKLVDQNRVDELAHIIRLEKYNDEIIKSVMRRLGNIHCDPVDKPVSTGDED
jgi:hypothetical protein